MVKLTQRHRPSAAPKAVDKAGPKIGHATARPAARSAKSAALANVSAKRPLTKSAPTKATAKAASKPIATKPSQPAAKKSAGTPIAKKPASPIAKVASAPPTATKAATKTVAKAMPPKAPKPAAKTESKPSKLAPPTKTPVTSAKTATTNVSTKPKILVHAAAPGDREHQRNGHQSPAASEPPRKNGKSMGRKPTNQAAVVMSPDYRPSEREPFMNGHQRIYFRNKLAQWKDDIIKQNRETLHVLHEDTIQHSDLADRATSETDRALDLRARDRQRKLVSKIDAAIARIDDGSYGYCEETGEPISLKRLDARPIATMSLEAQERHERREKVYRED